MNFTLEEWFQVIETTVPAHTIDVNKKAFETGYYLYQKELIKTS
jgi:indolepyruvate ferredoxin oxidoreductase beta subunit